MLQQSTLAAKIPSSAQTESSLGLKKIGRLPFNMLWLTKKKSEFVFKHILLTLQKLGWFVFNKLN